MSSTTKYFTHYGGVDEDSGGSNKNSVIILAIIINTIRWVINFIINFVVIFIKLLIALFLLYLIYSFIFKGYSRGFFDIITLSFFHREDLEAILRESNLNAQAIKFLNGNITFTINGSKAEGVNNYDKAYELYNKCFNTTTKLKSLINDFVSASTYIYCNKNDKDMRDDFYYNALRDYYLYYDTVNYHKDFYKIYFDPRKYITFFIKDIKTIDDYNKAVANFPKDKDIQKTNFVEFTNGSVVEINVDENNHRFILVQYPGFYNRFTMFNRANKQTEATDLNTEQVASKYTRTETQLLFDTYVKDGIPKSDKIVTEELKRKFDKLPVPAKLKNHYKEPYSNRLVQSYMKDLITSIGLELLNINEKILNKSLISYINIPSTTNVAAQLMDEYFLFKDKIFSGEIYKSSVSYYSISDIGWCIFEFFSSTIHNTYDLFQNSSPSLNEDEKRELIIYLNMSRTDRQMIDNTEKKSINRNDSRLARLDYFKKRPIFASVYLSQNDKNPDRKELYNDVMRIYSILYDNPNITFTSVDDFMTSINNLQINAYLLKQFALHTSFLELYIVHYQEDLTKLYAKQYKTRGSFFTELSKHYVDEIVNDKIKVFTKKVFNGRNWAKAYSGYKAFNKEIGNLLRKAISTAYKHFFTSTPVETPQGESPDEPAEQSPDQTQSQDQTQGES